MLIDSTPVSNDTTFSVPFLCYYFHSQVSFSPDKAGSYRAILQLLSLNKTPLATIALLATSEQPHVQFLTSSDDSIVSLDFGAVFSGKRAILPLYVMNHGQSNVPLRLSLATVSKFITLFTIEKLVLVLC